MDKWIAEELREDQRLEERRVETSYFGAWMRNTYGSKHFVMAIIEAGLSWAAPAGASEHGSSSAARSPSGTDAIARLSKWVLKVTKAIDNHKKNPKVQEQRRRSGPKKYTSGLTPEERNLQTVRARARQDYFMGLDLFHCLKMHKG